MLEIGINSALATYGLIIVWTVLARFGWLPKVLVRGVHRPLDRMGRIPLIGGVVNAFRRHPLVLGFGVASLVGLVVPYVMLSAMWFMYGMSFVFVISLVAWALFSGDGDDDLAASEPDSYRLYHEKHGQGLVYGSSPRADDNRPLL